jgi:hypothetical protein
MCPSWWILEGCFRMKKKFRFEKWWMEREDFNEVVNRAWNSSAGEGYAMYTWQNKIRNFRRMVRGWASNVVAELNRNKQFLLNLIGLT